MNTFEPLHYSELNLIAVDVQNDFCVGGSLAIKEGDLVVPALNKVINALHLPVRQVWTGRDNTNIRQQVFATRDWHPLITNHFSDEPNYQTTWPVHCVAGTQGAAFHPDLALRDNESVVRVISKGTDVNEGAYSGFDGITELGTPLSELIDSNRKRTAIFIGGLATDYCVKATVLDALNLGYETFVITDAIRGVASLTTASALEEMQNAGAIFATSDQIVETLARY